MWGWGQSSHGRKGGSRETLPWAFRGSVLEGMGPHLHGDNPHRAKAKGAPPHLSLRRGRELAHHLPHVHCPSQEPCQRELHSVLDRLAQEQQRMGGRLYKFHLPNCSKNGFYHSKQVRVPWGPIPAKPHSPHTRCPVPNALQKAPSRSVKQGPALWLGSGRTTGQIIDEVRQTQTQSEEPFSTQGGTGPVAVTGRRRMRPAWWRNGSGWVCPRPWPELPSVRCAWCWVAGCSSSPASLTFFSPAVRGVSGWRAGALLVCVPPER